ncbi:MAG: hypothetical protein H8E56_02070 [Candidatus Marinimicrobia bacterium]|nr:hypothetical protein [Candidatus Neomarinimicrobiota bacterium]
MKQLFILFVIGFAIGTAQTDSLSWKQYARIGGVNAEKTAGGFGYYRLNRKTDNTFRDLRLFGYGLQKDSFIYIRYKSSDKYISRPQFYRYTVTSYRKNTRAGVKLQYHFNQGFGYFINEYKNGLLNLEIGHAFDMSDYLNEERKTSYVKTGVFWDHNTTRFSTKLEVEHFQQISEIHVSNLTRNQYLFEVIFPIKNGLSININYELEDYLGQSQANVSSFSIALDWQGNLKWDR